MHNGHDDICWIHAVLITRQHSGRILHVCEHVRGVHGKEHQVYAMLAPYTMLPVEEERHLTAAAAKRI